MSTTVQLSSPATLAEVRYKHTSCRINHNFHATDRRNPEKIEARDIDVSLQEGKENKLNIYPDNLTS